MNKEEKLKIAVYAQHTARAGKVCNDDAKIDDESDDIVIFEYLESEMIEIALRWLDDKTANGSWKRQSARSILAEIDYDFDD